MPDLLHVREILRAEFAEFGAGDYCKSWKRFLFCFFLEGGERKRWKSLFLVHKSLFFFWGSPTSFVFCLVFLGECWEGGGLGVEEAQRKL